MDLGFGAVGAAGVGGFFGLVVGARGGRRDGAMADNGERGGNRVVLESGDDMGEPGGWVNLRCALEDVAGAREGRP